ncbi:hypothetical protein ABPG77_006684 [Micractinium sp. CCAP 211/92]
MEQQDGGRAPDLPADGAPWMAGRVEERSDSEWTVLFPVGGADTAASAVAAFPSEVQAQQALQLLQLHVLLSARPSLPLDQLPPELAGAVIQTGDGQVDVDMLADLQAMRPGEVVEMVQQMAAEMEAEAEVDSGSGGGADEQGWTAAGAAADHPATQARSIGSAAPVPPSAAGPAAAAGAAVGEVRRLPVPVVAPPQPPSIELQQEQATQQQELATQQQHQATQQQRQEQEQQPAQQQKERQQEQQHQEQQERQQLAQQEQEQQKEQQQPSQHQQEQQPVQQQEQQHWEAQQHGHQPTHQVSTSEHPQPPPQQPVAAQPSSATAAVSGDASASDYLGVRPAPGGCGGWLAEVSVWLGPAGQPDPGGQRQRQAVPVGTELEAACARDLVLVWLEAWSGPSSAPPICNFPFKRYCQDARLWAVLCELPCWHDLAAYLEQLQEDGSLLKAAQAYDDGSLPGTWPEPAAQPAGAAPPAAQHPATQQVNGDDYPGRRGTGPPRALGRAGADGGRSRPGAASGRGAKRKADAPAAGDQGQRQRGRPAGGTPASGYPGVTRCTWSGRWRGRIRPPGGRSPCDVLLDDDVQIAAVGQQLALLWASLVSQGKQRPTLHPALRDGFLADPELMRQLGAAKDAADMRKLVRQLQQAGQLQKWCHLLPPPLTNSRRPPQQTQQAALRADADWADGSAGESAAVTGEEGEPSGPAAARRANGSAALDALAALAEELGASSPPAAVPPAWACAEQQQEGPPLSQGTSTAAAAAAAGGGVEPAQPPQEGGVRSATWQHLSWQEAQAWPDRLQSAAPLPDSRPAANRGAAAGAEPEAGAAAAGGAQAPLVWLEPAAAWQHVSQHAAERWEASVPCEAPSWLTDDAQLQDMLLPGAGAEPSPLHPQPVGMPPAPGLGAPGAAVQLPWPPQQQAAAAAAARKAQHTAALAQPDQQLPHQPEGSATTACTVLDWHPAARVAGGPSAAAAGEASPTSPQLLQPAGAPPPAALAPQPGGQALPATPAGSALAALPASAAAQLQLLLARLPMERLPEAADAGRTPPPGLAQPGHAPLQHALQAGDVLLYCRKTNGLAGLPLLERLLVLEARREGGPGLGPRASQQHCECLLLASGATEGHLAPPEPLPPGTTSATAAAVLGRVALLTRSACKQRAAAVRSARQWCRVGRVPDKPFAEVLAALSPQQ